MEKYNMNSNAIESLTKELFEYRKKSDEKIRSLTEKNEALEKKLNAITNIVEISKYINLNISDDELTLMINDMIIGILGVTHSVIYVKKEGKYLVQASNIEEDELINFQQKYSKYLETDKYFIVNSNVLLGEEPYSIIGVPIFLKNTPLGFIVVEQKFEYFFCEEHLDFITAIANHIGIALENNMLYKKIRENSIRDPLMGIYNRKYFFETLHNIIKDDESRKFAIVMVDLDDFKKINDEYGHQIGDVVLMEVSKIILKGIEPKDILARYGGEEFIVYMHDISNVENKFEKIRIEIENTNINSTTGNILNITATFGISIYKDNDLDKSVQQADEALYIGKSKGKNRIIMAQ